MNHSADNGWYKIGEIARMVDVAVETIRMYEREGILLTEKSTNGQRRFNNDDLNWIRCIRRLIKEQGLNIEGIRRLISLLPCWDLRPCTAAEQRQCPAFLGALQPCWTMKEQIPESCRDTNCRQCDVYLSVTRCENLKKVIYRIPAAPQKGRRPHQSQPIAVEQHQN